MKRFSLLSLLAATVITAHASDTTLRVTLTDGKHETYSLARKPSISFAGDKMTVKADGLTSDYNRSDVRSLDFVELTSIFNQVTDCNTTHYSYTDNVFSCFGHEIRVYTATGASVISGKDTVSLAGLQSGVYIITVNNKSIKIIKR